MPEESRTNETASPYDIFILGLCIFALISIAMDTFFHLDSNTRLILTWSDTCVCIIFFIDFLNSLLRSENRWRYFITWGWIDLLSSIPSIDLLRWGRTARVFRVFRLLRGVRATKVLTNFILGKRAQSAFLAAVLILILMVTVSSITILQVESSSDSNIKSAGDAIWWSMVTLTTVGYGDKFPVTIGGRLIGIILMVGGVGLFGITSGFVASWFLSPMQKKENNDIGTLKQEILELRSIILESKNNLHKIR
jgi:voltage-gated potassium channel